MYLNTTLLQENLPCAYEFIRKGPPDNEEHLHRPILFYPGLELEENRCYVGAGESFAGVKFLPAGCCVISIGPPTVSLSAGQISFLYTTHTDMDVSRLFNEVQQVFDRFEAWDRQLAHCVESGTGLQSLLECSQPLFGTNYLVILNPNYRVRASTSGKENKTENMPSEVITGLKRDPDFVRFRASNRSMFLYKRKYINHDILFYKICMQGELWAILTLSETEQPISQGQQLLAAHLVQAILRYYQWHIHFSEQENIAAQVVLSGMLRDEPCEADNLHTLMKNLDWEAQASFQVYYVPTNQVDKQIGSVRHLCRRIEFLMHYAVAFEYETDVVVLLNITKLENFMVDWKEQFQSFLRGCALYAGASKIFNHIAQLRDYYEQAKAALRIGLRGKGGRTIHIHPFENVALEYMISNLAGTISPETICDPGLLQLREQDRSKGTMYLKTLDVFFSTGMNATHSAQQLFVNRSTFLERMARIRRLLHTDLEDGDGRLYLMLCLKLLGY